MSEEQPSVGTIFASFQEHIDSENADREKIRETVKELDRQSKLVESILLKIHQEPLGTSEVYHAVRGILSDKIRSLYEQLETKIPPGKYFVYYEHWRITTRRLAGACCLIYYLETEDLVTYETVAEMMGLKLQNTDANLYLDMEDYLFGLLEMATQLSRFSVNCVTKGDYGRPARIGNFMNKLNNGFRLLNLKNDYLRKSYDRLKWDLKKVEEVIYDLSIRGLASSAPANVSAENPQEDPK